MPIDKADERALFLSTREILNRYDLSGVHPGDPDGAPVYEYDTMTRNVESFLVNRGGIKSADLRAIWLKWFDDDLRGMPVDEVVAELNLMRANHLGV